MTISDRGYNQYYTKPIELEMPSVTNWQSIGGGQIGANQIYGQAITEAQLADGSVTSAKIGTISASDITTGTLNGSLVTVTNLNADNITTGTLNGANIEDLAITNGKLASGAVTAAKITAGTITATEIAASTITGAKIASGTITAGNIATGTITATQIAATTITGAKIASGTITAAKIASNTITSSEMNATDTYVFGKLWINGSPAVSRPLYVAGEASKTTGTAWINVSDRRLKKRIATVKGALSIIQRLKPSTFQMKKTHPALVGADGSRPSDKTHYGFIAQDIQEVLPEWVIDSGEYMELDTSGIEAILTAAVQEQQEIIKSLEARIEALEQK